MFKILKDLRFTALAVVLASSISLTAIVAGIDLIKLDEVEKIDVDDAVSGFVLILAGMTIDGWRRRKHHQEEIEAQRLRTLKATMRTVQDIVNNFLNSLMLFEIPAKEDMSHGSSTTVEELIQDTSQQLKALGDVESVVEHSLAIGAAGIEYPHKEQRR
jgi:hypothetical protein